MKTKPLNRYAIQMKAWELKIEAERIAHETDNEDLLRTSYELHIFGNELCHASARNGAIYWPLKDARKIIRGFEKAVKNGEFYHATQIYA